MCSISKDYFEKNGNLHEQAKAFLEKNGLLLENAKLAEWFKKRGFTVEGCHIKFKDWEIEHALKLCPTEVNLSMGKTRLTVGNSEVFYGFSGKPLSVLENQKLKTFSREDAIVIFKSIDTSRSVGFLAEFPWFCKHRNVLEQLAFLLKHSNKPLLFMPEVRGETQELYEALQLIYDYYEQSKSSQIIVPLKISDEGMVTWRQMEQIRCTADFHQALFLKIYPSTGENELLTEASLCTRMNAVLLGYCCIIQSLYPRFPIILGLSNRISHNRTAETLLGTVSGHILKIISRLWKYYQIPFVMENLPFEAQFPDVLAGIETMAGYRAMFDHCQANIMNCTLGGLSGGQWINMEKVLMDEEIIEMLTRLYRGIDCSEEKSCYDAIKNTGPRGSYFNTRMLKIIKKEFYDSRYLNKESLGNWRTESEQELTGHVGLALKKRLNTYIPPEITKEKNLLLNRYLRVEDKSITQFQNIKF